MKKYFVILFGIFLLTQSKQLFADQTAQTTASVTVPPKSSDYQFNLSAIDGKTTVSQNTILSYQITYGANTSGNLASTVTIVADYSGDTASDGTDVLDYVTSSATNAYNNTHPVVDILHRTITWTINSLPAGTTDQVVTFQLQTNGNYTEPSSVGLSIRARMSNQYLTLPDQIVQQSYVFNQTLLTPTPSSIPNTPSPTQLVITPTITKNPTPTITQIKTPMNIFVRSVSPTTISLEIQTDTPTQAIVLYGSEPDNLSNKLIYSSFSQVEDISLVNLQEKTSYYVKIQTIDTSGTIQNSDIFVFTTGQQSLAPQIDPQTITFVSSDVVLYTAPPSSQNQEKSATPQSPLIVIPQNVSYNFRFQFTQPLIIKRVQAIIRNRHVLGITSSESNDPNSISTDLIETQDGLFEGRLKSPSTPGSYEEFARIYDTQGNITEEKIAEMYVSQPLRVLDKQTKQPIESAQMYIYYANRHSDTYEPLPPQLFPIKNPGYTDINGEFSIPLPQGKYKIKVTAIGYNQENISFMLGKNPQENYPTIYLQREPFNISTTIFYYWTILLDVLGETRLYIQGLSNSIRFFEFNALLASTILVFLTLLSFSRRIHIPLRSLTQYFFHYAQIASIKEKFGNKIVGRLFDKENGAIIPHADVYLIDAQRDTVLGHTITNNNGDFRFLAQPHQGYNIQVMADGFEPVTFLQSEIQAVELGGYLLSIQKRRTKVNIKEKFTIMSEKMLSLWFETLLITSFIFELSLGYTLGWTKAIVFITISLINLTLWLVHLSHLRTEKNIF